MRRRLLLHTLAIIVSVLPSAITAISYFPLWAERGGEAALSGFTAFLLLLSALPLYRLVKRALASPSVWVMWLFSFLLFYLTSSIADEMIVISLVGTISNGVGAILFRLARRGERHE